MYLGISSYNHESAVALVNDEGFLLDFCKEEFLTRIKGDKSFPKKSLELILHNQSLKIK